MNFVRNNYGIDPRRYWLIEHADEAAAAAMEELLAGAASPAWATARERRRTSPHAHEKDTL